jgi:hypothetical protein
MGKILLLIADDDSATRKIWPLHDRGHEQGGHEIFSVFGCGAGPGRAGSEFLATP